MIKGEVIGTMRDQGLKLMDKLKIIRLYLASDWRRIKHTIFIDRAIQVTKTIDWRKF